MRCTICLNISHLGINAGSTGGLPDSVLVLELVSTLLRDVPSAGLASDDKASAGIFATLEDSIILVPRLDKCSSSDDGDKKFRGGPDDASNKSEDFS